MIKKFLAAALLSVVSIFSFAASSMHWSNGTWDVTINTRDETKCPAWAFPTIAVNKVTRQSTAGCGVINMEQGQVFIIDEESDFGAIPLADMTVMVDGNVVRKPDSGNGTNPNSI